MVKNIETWKWSSYKAMTGEAPTASWLETNWILLQFSKPRKRAIERYVDFVREGAGLPSLWSHLKNQIFLGSENYCQ
jgi:hypothetical protein